MLREHTEQQADNLAPSSARPIVLIEWEHSGTPELLCATGIITYDSRLFGLAPITVNKVVNGVSALLTLTATNERIAESINNTWREGLCRIYNIPAQPADNRGYAAEEAIVQIDGEIDSSQWDGADKIKIDVRQTTISSNRTPRDRLDNFGNHMPAPGTAFRWEDDEIILVKER